MTLFGYCRCSKDDGTLSMDLQRDALIAAGVAPEHIYSDLASGKREDRPGLAACLKALRKGDSILVWKLDRLGRSVRQLVPTVEDLHKRGIHFKPLTGFPFEASKRQVNVSDFCRLAEFERELIVERTKAGLGAARARGRVGGRKSKMTKAKRQMAAAAKANKVTNVGTLAAEFGVSRQTIYRHIRPNGELRSKQ